MLILFVDAGKMWHHPDYVRMAAKSQPTENQLVLVRPEPDAQKGELCSEMIEQINV